MGKKLILSLLIVVALGLGVAFWLFQTPAPEPEAVVVARLPAASGRDTAADTGRAAPDCGRRRFGGAGAAARP
jgi:hypothetical protein